MLKLDMTDFFKKAVLQKVLDYLTLKQLGFVGLLNLNLDNLVFLNKNLKTNKCLIIAKNQM